MPNDSMVGSARLLVTVILQARSGGKELGRWMCSLQASLSNIKGSTSMIGVQKAAETVTGEPMEFNDCTRKRDGVTPAILYW